MRAIELLERSLVGLFPLLFCAVDLEKSNRLIPAAEELIMPSRLLITHGGCRAAVQIFGVDLCLLVLRPKRSMVQLGSHIMNAPGIL